MPDLREDQAAIAVRVAGVTLDSKPWTSMSGGDVEATDVKTRRGGMVPEESLGGPASRSDCTVTRQYSTELLHPQRLRLERACGKAAMAVGYTPLDADGNPAGNTITISGTLKTVTVPNSDANNSAAQFLTLVMSCHLDASSSRN